MKCFIENPTRFALCVVMGFLDAKNTTAKILQQLCCVYGPSIMSEGKKQQWVRQLKDGQTDLHVEDRCAHPPCRESSNKSHENQQSTISELYR
jgi:hypothetical protein